MDSHTNFSYSTVATAPIPADTGTSVVVQLGDGAKFPTPAPFNAVVCAANQSPILSNSEIVRVTSVATDTFTITRQQEGSSARSILVGDQIFAAITKKTLTDIEAVISPLGAVQMYMGTADPAGGNWVIVDGRNITRSSHPDFSTWAVANGLSYDATNIHLPDMRQKFPLGKAASGTGSTLLGTGGAIDHTHSVPGLSVPSASCSVTVPNLTLFANVTLSDGSHGVAGGVQASPATGSVLPVSGSAIGASASGSTSSATTGGGTSGAQNPPYIAVNFIIRVL